MAKRESNIVSTVGEDGKLNQEGTYHFEDMVKFKASYPESWKKKKHLKDGKVYDLHRLHAERLAFKGIGEIVE
jgi:hypothetical protein